MATLSSRTMLLSCVFLLAGCGDSTSTPAKTDAGATSDAVASDVAATEASATDAAPTDSSATDVGSDSSEGGASFVLKVEDYLSWCTVSVNGGTSRTDLTQTITVPSGTVVTLTADTASASSFFWAYWVGTAGDTSSSHDTSKSTTVTVTKDTVVQACCPINGTSPSCPAPTP